MTPDAEAFVQAALAAQLPLQSWGAAIVGLGNGAVTLSCPIAEPLTTAGTAVVMGGIVATVADVAAGLSIISALDPPRPVTTIDFSVHSIAPAKGDRLEAVGQLLKAGRSIAIAGAQVFAIDGQNRRLCATLTATFAVAA